MTPFFIKVLTTSAPVFSSAGPARHADFIGNLPTRGFFLAISAWRKAHPLLLLLAALAALEAAPALIAALELLLARPASGGLARGQVSSRWSSSPDSRFPLPGVHDLLLGNPALGGAGLLLVCPGSGRLSAALEGWAARRLAASTAFGAFWPFWPPLGAPPRPWFWGSARPMGPPLWGPPSWRRAWAPVHVGIDTLDALHLKLFWVKHSKIRESSPVVRTCI